MDLFAILSPSKVLPGIWASYCLTNSNLQVITSRFITDSFETHKLYEGEVAGEIMAQELLCKETSGFGRRVSMYVDNQAPILSTQSIKPTPGHYLLDILHKKVSHTKKKFHNVDIIIRCIPSHLDVEGNEEADRQAKRAAKGDADSPPNRLPPEFRNTLPNSKSAIKQTMLKTLKRDASEALRKSPPPIEVKQGFKNKK